MPLRLHVAFALLVIALLLVSGWVVWRDAFPEWRNYQRELVRRERARLETELEAERERLARPEVRYELARLDAEIRAAVADTSAPAARLAPILEHLKDNRARLDVARRELREADRRLREPAIDARRREIGEQLERVRQAYARATGTWPPDTLGLRRLWVLRDSLSNLLFRVEGPAQRLRDSLQRLESETLTLRVAAARLTSARDSLESARARLLEPVEARESALERLRRHRPRIRQITSPDGREVARCPTCHGAMDDAPGVHPALPAMEIFREVPCTVCHRGRGRALTVAEAHRGLLAGGDYAAGPFSLRGRIERLVSSDPAERERAREELWQITGVEPGIGREADGRIANPDSVAAASWAAWWKTAAPYFEPGAGEGDAGGNAPLLQSGVDPWRFTARGRPLRYVGSQKCLSCHETLHREHSRRWLATKFRSIERLVDERDPRPCFPCHTTGYDPATGAYAEPGVTCEGCHGPGERYDEMMVVGQELVAKGDEVRGRALLSEASRLAREAVSRRLILADAGEVNLCVTCHNPREHRDRGPGVLEREPPVMPGDPSARRTTARTSG